MCVRVDNIDDRTSIFCAGLMHVRHERMGVWCIMNGGSIVNVDWQEVAFFLSLPHSLSRRFDIWISVCERTRFWCAQTFFFARRHYSRVRSIHIYNNRVTCALCTRPPRHGQTP